jgi:hypothetical protein
VCLELLRLPATALEVLGTAVLVGIVLVRALTVDVVLVVHLLCLPLGLPLSLLAVEPVLALGLGELVNLLRVSSQCLLRTDSWKYVYLSTSETSEELLGELVRDGLACSSGQQKHVVEVQMDVPSARWWSSKALKPAKAAPPATTS